MEQTVCEEMHKNIDKSIDVLTQRTNNHSERLDKLENNQVRTETIVTNLCKQLESLTKVLWWFVALMGSTGLGFIIWYIQSH